MESTARATADARRGIDEPARSHSRRADRQRGGNMRGVLRATCAGAFVGLAVVAFTAGTSVAYTRALVAVSDGEPRAMLSPDCTLQAYNICSCYIWVYSDQEHAVWGTVLSPGDCPGECEAGTAVTDVLLYSRCATPPARIDGVRIQSVDAAGCPTALLYESGPVDLPHCVSGDRWTTIPVPRVEVTGNPFVVQVEWGQADTLASDNSEKNDECAEGIPEGCACPGFPCRGWVLPPQRSFIYVTDIDGDGRLDDLCALEGAPEPLPWGGGLPDNLLVSVVLDCEPPTAIAPNTWGRVKHLFE